MTKLEPIKPSAAPEGSQKKLSFGSAAPAAKRERTEQIDDGMATRKPFRAASGREVEEDPITVDPLTPRKPKAHPALALARANAADEKANSPLNIAGTQFIIPSNQDPAVLAELPRDIRSRLISQAKRAPAVRSREASPAVKSRSHSPAHTDDIPSDVDPEVFHALPEEMKAEVLASYGRRKRPPRGAQQQTVLPQSPRKDKVINRPKDKTTPTKRAGIKTLFSRVRERERQHDAGAGLMQTSFAPLPRAAAQPQQDNNSVDPMVDDLDPAFLAELPEDVRREVVEDHRRRRRQRLAQRSGLSLHVPARRRHENEGEREAPRGQTRLKFPAKPPKAAFTQSGLTSLKEIKEMVGAWHAATQDEGPHRADVQVFERYVARVVTEERDMEKARVLVKWLAWMVEEEGVDGAGKESWWEAVRGVKAAVQEAMKERGLGPMDLG
jgi:DNA repair protein REV1